MYCGVVGVAILICGLYGGWCGIGVDWWRVEGGGEGGWLGVLSYSFLKLATYPPQYGTNQILKEGKDGNFPILPSISVHAAHSRFCTCEWKCGDCEWERVHTCTGVCMKINRIMTKTKDGDYGAMISSSVRVYKWHLFNDLDTFYSWCDITLTDALCCPLLFLLIIFDLAFKIVLFCLLSP